MRILFCLTCAFGLITAVPHERSLSAWDQEVQDESREIQQDLSSVEKIMEQETEPHWMDGVGWADTGMTGREFFDIKTWEDIDSRANEPQAKQYVDGKIQVYYSINPADAMKKLAEVGSLLRLAYSGSKGFKCSSDILRVLSDYQDLVKDSLVTSSTFVEMVLRALKYHKIAMIFMEHKKTDKVLRYLKKCATMAEKMATEADSLVNKAEELKQLSVDALIAANDDYHGSVSDRKKLQKVINDLKVERAKQEQMKTDVDALVKEAIEEEKRNGAMAKEKEFWGMIIGVFSPLAQTAMTSVIPALVGDAPLSEDDGDFPDGRGGFPDGGDGGPDGGGFPDGGDGGLPGGAGLPGGGGIPGGEIPEGGGEPGCGGGGGSGIDQAASLARCREASARAARINWQRKQMQNNAELASTVEKLMQTTTEKDELDKAIYGLEITIKTLGKVKTIFLNAKVFWLGVKKHVESLAATNEELEDYAEDEDLHGELEEGIMNSGYSWLSVGKICKMSAETIRKVDSEVDEILNDLPTEAEAKELIQKLGAKIIGDIKVENEDIEDDISSDRNKLPLPSPLALPKTDPTLPEVKRG